jgi:hypothetical protein
MPLRTEAQFLRERAKRLRGIAASAPNSPLSPELIDMANELEERASDLETGASREDEPG